MSELILLTDPVQPALPYAVDIEISAIAEENEDDQERYIAQAVTELHDVAALGGLINKQFVVDAKTALLIPKDARDFDDVDAQPIDKTVFEGRFKHYQPIYRKVGGQTTRSLYLAFGDAITVPFSSLLEGPRLVHVRAFDVLDINRVAA